MEVDTYTEFYKLHQETAEIKAMIQEIITALQEGGDEENTDNNDEDETEEETDNQEIKIESNVKTR